MGHRLNADILLNPRDQVDGLASCTSSRAVGYRDVRRGQRFERLNGLEQVPKTDVVLGREELKGKARRAGLQLIADAHDETESTGRGRIRTFVGLRQRVYSPSPLASSGTRPCHVPAAHSPQRTGSSVFPQ